LTLIVFDGLDASGKNTQATRLYNYFKKYQKTVFLRFHPSEDVFWGTKAREFLFIKRKGTYFTAAIFYMLDVIRSILLYSWRKIDFIIFVRYLMGTAYLPSPLHRIAFHFFSLIVPTSDYMFFLDVRPEEAVKRIQEARRREEVFETFEELKQTRNKALSLALEGKWTIVDANKSIINVEREIRKHLNID
jgi:dTMP kinase